MQPESLYEVLTDDVDADAPDGLVPADPANASSRASTSRGPRLGWWHCGVDAENLLYSTPLHIFTQRSFYKTLAMYVFGEVDASL